MEPVGILKACTMNVRMKVARMNATTSDSRYSRATDFLKVGRGEGRTPSSRHFSLKRPVSPGASSRAAPAGSSRAFSARQTSLTSAGRVAVVEGLVVRAHAVLGAEAAPEGA